MLLLLVSVGSVCRSLIVVDWLVVVHGLLFFFCYLLLMSVLMQCVFCYCLFVVCC